MNTDILINALKEYDMLKQMEICNANIMLLSNIQGENEWVVAWKEFDQYLMKKNDMRCHYGSSKESVNTKGLFNIQQHK